MARTATCPSCGAPVVFRSAASIFAVCDYCRSTLVRHDQALEDIGKMAALAEDRSPLRLGAEGRWLGRHFALLGRIQLKYAQGLWNEWYLLFDDQTTGWLSEAGGEYVLSFLHPVDEPLPAFEDLRPGQRLVAASRAWTVSDVEAAECIAGEGELPFKVGPGYPAPVADLRAGGHFATLDYSETPPLLFVGSPVPFASLAMTGLREGAALAAPGVQAEVFRCPACGSSLSVRSGDILAVGCTACGAVVDTGERNYRLLCAALGDGGDKVPPCLPVGSRGNLDGQSVEVIGVLVRRTLGCAPAYAWREYLLAVEDGGYRWLTEYDGHWNVAEVLSNPPAGGVAADVRYAGRSFKPCSSCRAEVVQVEGEFTWRVKRGEEALVADFAAPPLLLSRESSEREVAWSLARYVEPETIRAAFRLPSALPRPRGVCANQPNPWEATHRRACRLFWRLALAAAAIQAGFVLIGGEQRLLRQELVFVHPAAEETLNTDSFEVRGKVRKLVVTNRTSLDNNWIGLNLTLVDKASGAAWPATRELSFYSGYDRDGIWSEGSRDDEVVFAAIPPGTYYLAIEPDLSPDNPAPVRDRLEVAAGRVAWSNFFLLLIFLAVFPLFTRSRHAAFEARRREESDDAPAGEEADA